jgi:hypothetical protein
MRLTRFLLLVLLPMLVSCKVGRPPLGVAYVLREGATSRACYVPLVGDEGLRFADPVELPFVGPVDQLAFTSDGGVLWAWAGADEGDPGLWSLAFSGDRFGEPELRFDLAPYPAGLASAVLPLGDGAYFDARSPVTGLWQLFRLKGGELTQITPELGDCQSPALSPDGSLLVFSGERDGDWGLWGYETATGVVRPVFDTPADEGSPCFSPSRSLYFNRITYEGEEPRGAIWWLEDVDVADWEELPGLDGVALYPRPSPDGRWLLVTMCEGDRWMAHIVDLETFERWPLGGGDAEITFACWR